MKPENSAALSLSTCLRRRRFPGNAVIAVLAALGIILVLLLVGVWWKMASRPPIYTSMAKVLVKEPVPDSQTEDFRQWVIMTLTGVDLQTKAEKRTLAISPEFPPTSVDITLTHGQEPGEVYIFATGGKGDFTRAYLESVIDELIIIRMQSPVHGELSILERSSPCLQSEKLTFGRFLRLLQEGRPSS